VVENGVDVLPDVLPDEIADDEEAMAETIENNVRKLIVDKNPINPKYYESMSALLDGLISKRRSAAIKYAEYLKKISEIAKNVFHGQGATEYPALLQTREQKAIYDNFGQDSTRAIQLDAAIRTARQDDWKGNRMKERKVRVAIQRMLPDSTDEEIEALMNLALQQEGY
jgi:type I restriction enzyme R subunit